MTSTLRSKGINRVAQGVRNSRVFGGAKFLGNSSNCPPPNVSRKTSGPPNIFLWQTLWSGD